MTKTEAIALLGGSTRIAAQRIGVTRQAVEKWPKVLTTRIRDRVDAALYRTTRTDTIHTADQHVRKRAS